MENFLKKLGAGCGKLTACSMGCMIAVVILTFVVFLGVFGMVNPDRQVWYGEIKTPDFERKLFASLEEGIGAEAEGLTDIHGRLTVWFLWGFLLTLSPLPLAMVVVIANACHEKCGSVAAQVSFCQLGCLWLAWWVIGIVWRFRADGRFTCGDEEYFKSSEGETKSFFSIPPYVEDTLYQQQSCTFMKVFYIVCWAIQIIMVATCVIWSVLTMLCASET